MLKNPIEGRPTLLKTDIEGAELFMLRGARCFLLERSPSLLLSVHPQILPRYGHTKEDVAAFLGELNYKIQVLEIDHEEHWWCAR